jgi:hypothetical protein
VELKRDEQGAGNPKSQISIYLIIGIAVGALVVIAVVAGVVRWKCGAVYEAIDEEEEVPEIADEKNPTNAAQFQTSIEHVFDNPLFDDPAQALVDSSGQEFSDPDEALVLKA